MLCDDDFARELEEARAWEREADDDELEPMPVGRSVDEVARELGWWGDGQDPPPLPARGG